MTTLLWDRVGQRLYETGLDRGVLYLSDNSGVSWNGLTALDEDTGDDTVEPVYFDGVKYLDEQKYGDFAATLKAFTYPDEFLEYEGLMSIGNGMYIDDQSPKPFGLSFRTRVGNDLEGADYGYKIHLLYNLTAVPEATTFSTLSNDSTPTEFSWSITAVPVAVESYRPTAHVILDSRFLPEDVLAAIENILYGSDGFFGDVIYDGGAPGSHSSSLIDGGTPESEGVELPGSAEILPGDARLPSIEELFSIITLWGPRFIDQDTVTGLSVLEPGPGDLTQVNVPGIYTELPGSRLVETSTPGLYELGT